MKILFTGDINFRNAEDIAAEKPESLVCEVKSVFDDADIRIVNLETPLSDIKTAEPIRKCGPNLIAPKKDIALLTALRADAAAVANNHIGDYGDKAIIDTLNLLDSEGIAHFGAGKNTDDAYRAYRFEREGVSVSVIGACENEFGMATKNTYGSAGYDARTVFRRIREEKAVSDFVIIFFHGGNEYNPIPSPALRERYRLFCDMGADAVVATHTHCPEGYEIYDGKPIVYSMGNFFFKASDPVAAKPNWFYGYMTKLIIENGKITFVPVPYKFEQETSVIRLLTGEAKARFDNYLKKISAPIASDEEIKKYFMGWVWCHKRAPVQFDEGLEPRLYTSSFNTVACEAHAEVLAELFRIYHFERQEEAEKWSKKIISLQEEAAEIMP